MTRDEFGPDLFQAVKTIGSILALQDQYAGAVHRQDKAKMSDTLAKRDQMKRDLIPLMDRLSDADTAAIVNQYKWLLA